MAEQPKKRRKAVRREKRVAIRVTPELYAAIEERSYRAQKTMSALMVEAIIDYLGFAMPDRAK